MKAVELPPGWAQTEISDILVPQITGKPFQQGWSPQCLPQPAEDGAWGVLKTTAIQESEFWPHQNKALPASLDPKPNIEIKPGDVLMTCAGPRNRCGVACYVKDVRPRLMMSGKMYRFRPDVRAVEAMYLMHFLTAHDSQVKIDRMKTGINDSGLNLTHDRFSAFPIIVPPLPEQKRIVAKIEELFTKLDKGIESLRDAQERLKLYRQSLLKHAFEGKLTADWRAANAEKLESPFQILTRLKAEREGRHRQQLADWKASTASVTLTGKKQRIPAKPRPLKALREDLRDIELPLAELPFGWSWQRLGFATCGVDYGTSAKSADSGATPVLRMGNLQNGEIDWTDLVYTSDTEEAEKYKLHDGDVLFNRTNSPELVGKSALFKGTRQAIFAGYLVRVNQIESSVAGQLLVYYLNSIIAKKHGDNVKTDGVNQSNINGNRLQEYPFPFCSQEEQAELLLELDAKVSNVFRIETEIETQLAKADALRQSILKQAFSGKLVPQDPNDEPASVLLERIRAERAGAKPPKRQTRLRKAKEAA